MRTRKRKLGFAFKDEVLKVTHPHGHFSSKKIKDTDWKDTFLPNFRPYEETETVSSWRLVFAAGIFLVAFFGLFLRLFHLQIITGEKNRQLADSNRIQIRTIHAPRGVIYDRSGKVLAENNPGFRVKREFLTRDQALEMEVKNDPGFYELEIDTIRSYPRGNMFSPVLGYVGEVSEEELKNPLYQGYRLGDRIGRAGIESVYEKVLKGKDGAEIVEVDAQGKKIRSLRTIDPLPGQNVHLAIDADLQKTAYQALQESLKKNGSCCGTAVAVDPKNGEILLMVSLPSFDSNAFTNPQRSEEAAGYFDDKQSPLLNRAISGIYPPGSTFKIASALAGLSSGKINEHTLIEDTGVVYLGPYKFANWYFTEYGKTEGLVDIIKALQRSNDIFFYRVGEKVGEKKLGEVAKKIGMGKKLGIDLPNESDGLIPSMEWKRENIGEGWYPGDTLHMAIGQGFLLTTPLQVLAQTSFIAGDGILIQPHLASKITSPEGVLIRQFQFDPIVRDVFKKEEINLVKKGLEQVPRMGGTAWPFFSFSIPTAGKTGTAEFGDPKNRTHGWYTSYAPVENPQIALTVLVEAGGEGSNVAAPVAKEIYTWYFNTDKSHIKSLDTNFVASDSAKTLGE